MISVPVTIMRGGTSKGIFIMNNDLPANQEEKDTVICKVFGSPDIRQIDGLGGADVLTSKLAIIGPSTREDADVDYTFGQVSFEKKFVDYKGNCGNISSAVGPYAINKGLVKAVEPITTVRIHLTNSGQILTAEVPVVGGKAKVTGDCAIDGVPGTAARIDLDWSDITGTVCGRLLPTGNAIDEFTVDGKTYEVSLVDAGNPLVFIEAGSLGMTGIETPDEIEKNTELMEVIEKIRAKAAVVFGLVDREEDAYEKSPYNPFFAIVSSPRDYHCFNGRDVKEAEVDIVSRLLFMHHMHKTYPITGTVCTGAAMRIPGSISFKVMREEAKDREALHIGHPAGVLEVKSSAQITDQGIRMKSIKVFRTARPIMDGTAYITK
ncbi:MAG: 3-methylitaconate isomerase [Eubacterium sp.]|nr:3-methylitaconate isomerase [Eubacterium sp.]